MSTEYLLLAENMDRVADNLAAESKKFRAKADRYRRQAKSVNTIERRQQQAATLFNRRIDAGYSRYGAALTIAREWKTPLDSVLRWVFMSDRMALKAKREMRNDHIVRLHSKGLANDHIARHSAVVRLNSGEHLHPNSIPRIVRQTRQKTFAPTRIYRPIGT